MRDKPPDTPDEHESTSINELMLKQLESYSIGIIIFIVLQGITFSLYFGTNQFFNCRIHKSEMLSEILTLLFIMIAILAAISIRYIDAVKRRLCQDYRRMPKSIMIGKVTAVLILGNLPAFLTFNYGVLGKNPTYCEPTPSTASISGAAAVPLAGFIDPIEHFAMREGGA